MWLEHQDKPSENPWVASAAGNSSPGLLDHARRNILAYLHLDLWSLPADFVRGVKSVHPHLLYGAMVLRLSLF